MVDPGGQRPPTYPEWLIQVEGDLVKREFSSEGNAIPHIFRVPAQIREVSKDSFDAKFPFGLYDLETRENSVLDTYRKDFAEVFMQITGKGWKEICLEVVGDSPEKVEFWVKLYHGLDLESITVPDGADRKGKKKEPDRIDFIRTWLTLDAIFIVCFIQADHQLRCSRCAKHFPDFNKEMEKQALKSMVHVIRLDIFKFENQIPLGLIKNVVIMMYMGNKARDENNCQQHEGDNPFREFVTHAVRLIYCDLPGPRRPREFVHSVESLKIDDCRHLLQCLYSVICHKLQPPAQAPRAPSAQTPPASSPPGPSAQTPPAQAPPASSAQTTPAQAPPGPSAQTPLAQAPPTPPAPSAQTPPGPSAQTPLAQAPPTSLAQTPPAPSAQTTPAQAPPASSARTPLAQAPLAPSAQTSPAQGLPTPSAQGPKAQAPPGHVIPAQAPPDQVPPAQVPPGQTPPAQGNRKGLHHHNHTDLQYQHVPTVTRLKEAGITVTVKQDKTKRTFFASKNPFVAKCIADVKFERSRFLKGKLYLPAIGVYDETESLLRNLLTYEYVVEDQKDLVSFVYLMDNLLDTEQDVKMMKDTGVLKKNSLGSDKCVADMWNTLLTGVVFEVSPHYQEVFKNISVHYYKKRNRLWEEFTSFHLRKPWVVVGSILVAITFIATLLAMIYTILTYYYGNKQRPSS